MKKLKDNLIYSKSYWYTKGVCSFSKGDYLIARGIIENYEANLKEIERIENMSESKVHENEIIRLNALKAQVDIFDRALSWVPPEWRSMVKDKALRGKSWLKIEMEHSSCGEGFLHGLYQKFVYGIIEEAGGNLITGCEEESEVNHE